MGKEGKGMGGHEKGEGNGDGEEVRGAKRKDWGVKVGEGGDTPNFYLD